MQKVGVILVVGMVVFFVSMMPLNAFGVIDEDVAMYQWAMAAMALSLWQVVCLQAALRLGMPGRPDSRRASGRAGLRRGGAVMRRASSTIGLHRMGGTDTIDANGDHCMPLIPTIFHANKMGPRGTDSKGGRPDSAGQPGHLHCQVPDDAGHVLYDDAQRPRLGL